MKGRGNAFSLLDPPHRTCSINPKNLRLSTKALKFKRSRNPEQPKRRLNPESAQEGATKHERQKSM